MSPPGFWEIVFLAVLALLVFGPDKLPEMARKAGRLIGQLRREADVTLRELKQAVDAEEFDEVRRELHGVRDELRETARSADPMRAGARAEEGLGRRPALPDATGGAEDTPPPFDPDAT